ncbi:hypothetical protein OF83DRAFT_346993 [Amylostereum chailletii]|nr:hypothetical protein OF83DRAFT_346993 [Amylostereum chailletii]
MALLVIYNPVCGSSSGQQIAESQVLPLLHKHDKVPDKVVRTESSRHAGEIVVDFVKNAPPDGELTIVLVSGDGTLHDIVNALYTYANSREKKEKAIPQLRLVLVAGGTANALHSSYFPPSGLPDSSTLLSSLHSYLSPSSSLTPLTLTRTTILSPSDGEITSIVSAVVTSTSLHASILHDAEELRPSIPSLDRFKVAAEKNATRWYHARLHLHSAPSASTLGTHAPVPSPILQYDPTKDVFVPVVSTSSENDSSSSQVLELEGPFSYMLTTVNVDRLEPTFRISPLHRSHPPLSPQTTDVVVVRPLRDPSLDNESEESRSSFKAKVWGALGGAYQDGAHVKLRYGANGELAREGEGETVVECFRAGGWEWIPDAEDEKAHLVCADGTIVTIPAGGKAVSRVLSSADVGFDAVVYA